MSNTDYVNYIRLVALLDSWWIDNGWNPATLRNKTTHQLVAIHQRAVASNWAVKPKSESKQLSFSF